MACLNIQRLQLWDYRCFATISIEFDPQLTVLTAANGGGKTSILDAVAIAFGPYLSSFDEGKGRGFESSDIRLIRIRNTSTNEMEYAPQGVRLYASGHVPEGLFDTFDLPADWQRNLVSPSKAKTTIKDAFELRNYGKRLQAAVRTPDQIVDLPLLAYYGTGRLWQQKKLTQGKLPRTSRTVGYTDCMDPGSSYKTFVAWFRYWSTNAFAGRYEATKAGRAYEPTEFDHFIEAVSGAVNTCLNPAGWKAIEYSLSREELVAHHDQHGELPVSLLSDGIRNMIGMVADIAFRAAKLNPHLGARAALETSGIVLIDEVDMHLHPEWQQVVLQGLTSAFPRVQFIVTTHSPQVLSTVRPEHIRLIGQDADGQWHATQPLAQTYGEPSGNVLHRVMNVDPQPPIPEKSDLERLTAWVDQGDYERPEVQDLLQRLTDVLGAQHPQLQKLQRSIQRQQAMR